MREQASEKEEVKEETSERSMKIRSARLIRELKPTQRVIEQLLQSQVSQTKTCMTPSIPIKSTRQQEISQPRLPLLKARFRSFIKPKLLSVEVRPATLITPTISIIPKIMTLTNIRVPIFTPITIRELVMPPLKLKLKTCSDISVRPVYHPEPIRDLETSVLAIKLVRIAFQPPSIIPTLLEQSFSIYVPRISITPIKRELEEPLRAGESKDRATEALGGEDELKLFEDVSKFHEIITRGLGALRTLEDRPVCIVLPKPKGSSYVYSTALICRELYRIIKGGKPEPRWLSEGSKEEIEKHMRAGDMIFIVDDSKYRLLPALDKIRTGEDLFDRIKENRLFDRLHELFSQDLGFLIFHVGEQWANDFAKLLEREANYYIQKLVRIPLVRLPHEVERETSSICWGFVRVEGRDFDELFGEAERKYFEELKAVYDDIEFKHWINLDPDAGYEHEATKIVVAEALARELGAKERAEVIEMLKKGLVKTECEFRGGRADLCLEYPDGRKRYVEIETLYGTGDPITKKLDKGTLNKYMNMGRKVEVSVVLLGLHILLYMRDLLKLKRIYVREHGLNVDFYAVDIMSKRLVSVYDILRILKKLSPYVGEETSSDEIKKAFK